LADALFLQGAAQMYAGAGRAIPILSESVAISRTLAQPRWLGGALWALGRALHHQGDREGAEAALTESLARARELDNPSGIAVSLWGLGDLAGDQGNDARALDLLREALERLWEQGEAWSAILCLERLASIRAHDEPQPAVHLLSAAAAWRLAAGLPMPLEEQDRHQQTLTALRDHLGEVLFSRAWEIGEDLAPDEAVAEALETSGFHGRRRDRALRNAGAG
jgi:tetratricopeptide (TPR) repeat protein